MRKLIFILSLVALNLVGCFKEELPRVGGDIKAFSVAEMGENYDTQLFYSLIDTKFVSTNPFNIWHLGFYAQNDDYHIRLNSGSFMYAHPTGETNFNNVTALLDTYFAQIDHPSGDRNRLAINIEFNNNVNDTLFSSGQVFIIDMGSDLLGNLFGYKKIQFTKVYQNNYYIKYANLDGSDLQNIVVTKNPTLNYVAFNLLENTTKQLEPDRNTWDILFSRYTEILDAGAGIFINYSVTGAYINTAFVTAYMDSLNKFEDININNIEPQRLTNQQNIIGHDWKIFNIDANQYGIYNNKVYIIKDRNNFYYKLRFRSFYNQQGIKGYPGFEFEQL